MTLYVTEGSARRELEMDMKEKEKSDYDSDLNRTMF